MLTAAHETRSIDGSYGKLMLALAKTDLLILDDWGLAPIGNRERRDLLELIEDRVGRWFNCYE